MRRAGGGNKVDSGYDEGSVAEDAKSRTLQGYKINKIPSAKWAFQRARRGSTKIIASLLACSTHQMRLSIIKHTKDETRENTLDHRLCVPTQQAIPATSRMSHEALKCVALLPWSSATFASATVRSHKPDPRRYVLGTRI